VNSEEAIDIVLAEAYADKDALWTGVRQCKYVPFNPVDKYTIAFIQEEGRTFQLMKGAPQVDKQTDRQRDIQAGWTCQPTD
jgi:hypothetical protein